MTSFSFIDLFAGIGGFRLAMERNGGICSGFSEVDKNAISTYINNSSVSEEVNFGDITRIQTLPEHDLMTAGVPCQSWSIAGKRLGFNDSRGQLWNDTIFLLKESKPKAFIFENVKGLADSRNKEALEYIINNITEAGYHCKFTVLNSMDYDIPQSRERLFIVGFKEKEFSDRFEFPEKVTSDKRLFNHFNINIDFDVQNSIATLNTNKDFLTLADIRSGNMTVASWELQNCTQEEKLICNTIRSNRRKKEFNRGTGDGGPMYLSDIKRLNTNTNISDINSLIEKKILRNVDNLYNRYYIADDVYLTQEERNIFNSGIYISTKHLVENSIYNEDAMSSLIDKGHIVLFDSSYDFVNSKVSTGINGIGRIYTPLSKVYPTLVSSGGSDYITNEPIEAQTIESYKQGIIDAIKQGTIRKISKEEACIIQGFPEDYKLPEKSNKWIKQIGNSVSVPLIELLVKEIIKTYVFE